MEQLYGRNDTGDAVGGNAPQKVALSADEPQKLLRKCFSIIYRRKMLC